MKRDRNGRFVRRPLALDLYCGLGGWTEGLLAAGYYVVGFDIEQHIYGEHRYPAQLVLQDVLTLHGSQFRDAALIVGSSPCQEFSYRAMPWKRAKALGPPDLGMALFNAQFRIQAEASEAAGRHIPMLVENVRGAIPWVGRSRWNYGSYHLWGDVPALMPMTLKRGVKVGGLDWSKHGQPDYKTSGAAGCFRDSALKAPGGPRKGRAGFEGTMPRLTNPAEHGVKIVGDWFSDPQSTCRKHGSKSKGRKMASAMIAKIPFELSSHIAKVYFPTGEVG